MYYLLQFCVELVIGQTEGKRREQDLVQALLLDAENLSKLAPGTPLPLGSACLSSNLKLSFLSRKQMFLLSFSNFRVYFQDKCLFSHRIQFTFFNFLFGYISGICLLQKSYKLMDRQKGKKSLIISLLRDYSSYFGYSLLSFYQMSVCYLKRNRDHAMYNISQHAFFPSHYILNQPHVKSCAPIA